VNIERLADAALVVLGHGTSQNENSAAPVFQHAAELRRRNRFGEVREAFWKQEPQIKDVLTGIAAPRIFIAPLFISEGYFASEVIPRELGFGTRNSGWGLQNARGQTLHYCPPVGTHDSMTGVILARAKEVVEKFPFPRAPKAGETTLFIAGHGTERNAGSRRTIERQMELVRARKIYAGVHAVFLEEDPRVGDCYSLAQTKNIIVVPFFISDGLHTQEDIPVLLGENPKNVRQRLASGQPTWRNPSEHQAKRVWYASAVGSEPHVADVILERVRETAGRI